MAVTTRTKAARLLIALFGTGGVAVVGGLVALDAPATIPTVAMPCIGEDCYACLQPTVAECRVLAECDGNVCMYPPPLGASDPYDQAGGGLAVALRSGLVSNVLEGWKTEFVRNGAGTVTDCFVQVDLNREQRVAWRRQMSGPASPKLVNCNAAAIPAKAKRDGRPRPALRLGVDSSFAETNPEDNLTAEDLAREPPIQAIRALVR